MALAHQPTLADLLPAPAAPLGRLGRDALLVVAGSAIIAACAQINVQVGVVPFTGSTLGVMLVAALLGSRRGVAAVLAYLLEGACGLPVFAGLSAGGAILMGTSGGYLVGFIPAAFVTGWLSERGWDRRLWTSCLAMVIGNALVFAVGVPWLARFEGWEVAFQDGFLKFIPFDAGLKVLLAGAMLPLGWKLVRR